MTSPIITRARLTDINILKAIDQTPQSVCEQLAILARKVDEVATQLGGCAIVDGAWEVRLSEPYIKFKYECQFPPCSYQVAELRTYTVTNLANHCSIDLDEADLHVIECHHYFPKGKEVFQICHILNIKI